MRVSASRCLINAVQSRYAVSYAGPNRENGSLTYLEQGQVTASHQREGVGGKNAPATISASEKTV